MRRPALQVDLFLRRAAPLVGWGTRLCVEFSLCLSLSLSLSPCVKREARCVFMRGTRLSTNYYLQLLAGAVKLDVTNVSFIQTI